MLRRLARWLLPDWAQPDHPAIRFVLGRESRTSWRVFASYVFLAVVLSVFVLTIETSFPNDAPFTIGVIGGLSAFVLVTQSIFSSVMFGLGLRFISHQRARGTWDMLRATAGGTRQALRAAWAAALYRNSGMIGAAIYAPRLVFLVIATYDLMAFRGEYLIQMAGTADPSMPWVVGVVCFSLMLTAAFVLPLTALGLEASVGLLFSTFMPSRFVSGLWQAVLTFLRFGWGGIAIFWLNNTASSANIGPLEPVSGWSALIFGSASGDWAMSFLHVPQVEAFWRAVPYSIFVGAALVGVALLHLLLTELLLAWAARRAQRIDA